MRVQSGQKKNIVFISNSMQIKTLQAWVRPAGQGGKNSRAVLATKFVVGWAEKTYVFAVPGAVVVDGDTRLDVGDLCR